MSEASISKLKSIVAKVRTSETGLTLESEQSEDTPRGKDDAGQVDSDTTSQASAKSKKSKVISFGPSLLLSYLSGVLISSIDRVLSSHFSSRKKQKRQLCLKMNYRKEQRVQQVMMMWKMY